MLCRLPHLAAIAATIAVLTLPARALAQEVQGGAAVVSSPAAPKRWSVARDLAAVLPVGALAADSGPMLGPLVRLGFQATSRVEVGMRSGYLYGLDKDVGADRMSALSAIPIFACARAFFLAEGVGPYAAVEIGANVLRRRYRSAAESGLFEIDLHAQESRWTAGADVGAGWVLSRKLPIDLRAQIAALDLLSSRGPTHGIAIGGTAGWTIFF